MAWQDKSQQNACNTIHESETHRLFIYMGAKKNWIQSRHLKRQLGLLWGITGANLRTNAVNRGGLRTIIPMSQRALLFGGLEKVTKIQELHRNISLRSKIWKRPWHVCRRHLKQRTKQRLTWRYSWKQWELSLKDVSKAKGDFYLTCIGLLSPHMT